MPSSIVTRVIDDGDIRNGSNEKHSAWLSQKQR